MYLWGKWVQVRIYFTLVYDAMITEQEALELLKKYTLPQQVIDHCKGVSAICFEMANKILAKHPDLPIAPEKVKIAGLLHDIGKSQPGIHEINTVHILKKEGL